MYKSNLHELNSHITWCNVTKGCLEWNFVQNTVIVIVKRYKNNYNNFSLRYIFVVLNDVLGSTSATHIFVCNVRTIFGVYVPTSIQRVVYRQKINKFVINL